MSATAFALEQLHGLVDRFAGRRLLVLGDLMLDHYLWGRWNRGQRTRARPRPCQETAVDRRRARP